MIHPQRGRAQLAVFYFNGATTTDIYTLSLHDALPISVTTILRGKVIVEGGRLARDGREGQLIPRKISGEVLGRPRSEEHTSELQSLAYLVSRLLLEKKKPIIVCHR